MSEHLKREASSEPSPEQKVGIFVDAENVGAILRNDGARTLVDIASEFGSPVVRKAYGNWKKLSTSHEQSLVDRGFQLVRHRRCRVLVCIWQIHDTDFVEWQIHTPHAVPRKNAADIAMVIDVIEIQQNMPELDCFVLVSSDSDFFQLFVHLKQAGCQVVGVCSQHSALRKRAQTTCDRFIFLDPKKNANHAKEVEQQIEENLASENLSAGGVPFATHQELFNFLKSNTAGKQMRKRMVKLYKAYCRQKPWLSGSMSPKQTNPEFLSFIRHVQRLRAQQTAAAGARLRGLSAKQAKKQEKQKKLAGRYLELQSEQSGTASVARQSEEQDLSLMGMPRKDQFLSRKEQLAVEDEIRILRGKEARGSVQEEFGEAALDMEEKEREEKAERRWSARREGNADAYPALLAPPSILPRTQPSHAMHMLACAPALALSQPAVTAVTAVYPPHSSSGFWLCSPCLSLHWVALCPPPRLPSLCAAFLAAHPSLLPRRSIQPAPRPSPSHNPFSFWLRARARLAIAKLSVGGTTLRRAAGGGVASFLLACSFTVAAAEGHKEKDARVRRCSEALNST